MFPGNDVLLLVGLLHAIGIGICMTYADARFGQMAIPKLGGFMLMLPFWALWFQGRWIALVIAILLAVIAYCAGLSSRFRSKESNTRLDQ